MKWKTKSLNIISTTGYYSPKSSKAFYQKHSWKIVFTEEFNLKPSQLRKQTVMRGMLMKSKSNDQ